MQQLRLLRNEAKAPSNAGALFHPPLCDFWRIKRPKPPIPGPELIQGFEKMFLTKVWPQNI